MVMRVIGKCVVSVWAGGYGCIRIWAATCGHDSRLDVPCGMTGLRSEALDSSLHCAAFRMTVGSEVSTGVPSGNL